MIVIRRRIILNQTGKACLCQSREQAKHQQEDAEKDDNSGEEIHDYKKIISVAGDNHLSPIVC